MTTRFEEDPISGHRFVPLSSKLSYCLLQVRQQNVQILFLGEICSNPELSAFEAKLWSIHDQMRDCNITIDLCLISSFNKDAVEVMMRIYRAQKNNCRDLSVRFKYDSQPCQRWNVFGLSRLIETHTLL